MTAPDDVRRVLDVLAVHPVLPPAEALPPNDEGFQALLADLSRGEGSSHRALLRETATDRVISVGELARRAEFLLACLVLPAAGTHYRLLGVAPDATPEEIRRRWAMLIQRYHPDHLAGGAGSGWLDEQARRLIEAYQTLKDPERRRAYDAELARAGTSASPQPAPPRLPGTPPVRLAPPPRWRWVPVGILAVGVAAGVWVFARPAPAPLPAAPLPPAPKLLEQWGQGTAPPARPARAPVAPGPAAPAGSTQSAVPLAVPPATAAAGEVAPSPTPVPAAAPPRTPPAAPTTAAAAVAPEQKAGPPERSVAMARPAAPAPAAAPPTPRARPAAASVEAPVTTGGPPPAPSPVASPVPAPGPVTARAEAPPLEDWLGVIEAFREAYQRKDVPGLMAVLAGDVRERGVAGRVAVERLYSSNFAVLDGIRYDVDQLELVRGGPDELVVNARFRLRATYVGPPARAVDLAGPVRWVLRREAGRLWIAAIDYEVSR